MKASYQGSWIRAGQNLAWSHCLCTFEWAQPKGICSLKEMEQYLSSNSSWWIGRRNWCVLWCDGAYMENVILSFLYVCTGTKGKPLQSAIIIIYLYHHHRCAKEQGAFGAWRRTFDLILQFSSWWLKWICHLVCLHWWSSSVFFPVSRFVIFMSDKYYILGQILVCFQLWF